ncbi:phosphoenolpyruvate carboxykinase (GTP) [Bacillus pumilus]|uniref:phosphoenolpyruvate carboxykinase (GTP) n=1 Tax=Bacillus pumilus TaxID=1408 RepID=UPI0011A48615|nr:phosphoenolpyruvate carboxykinase (GTP) [Bacillus pumilus]
MDEKLINLIEQLAADVSIIKQDVKEIKSTVTKLEENEPEEIMAMLKLIKKDIERELRYTDKRFSEVDRKIYGIEERLNN